MSPFPTSFSSSKLSLHILCLCNLTNSTSYFFVDQEVIAGAGLKLVETDEYSESGRGVYPDGLFRVLLHFHERYKHLNVPFIITENGVSDETDLIRQPYLLEHLLAIYAAMMMVLTLDLPYLIPKLFCHKFIKL